MPVAEPAELRAAEVIALGVLHGPAELLPISSSGHVAVVPWLLRWDYADAEPELRKAVEVALHAGTALALLIGLRSEVADAARGLDRRRIELLVLSFVPPAVVALAFERFVERKLGTPPSIAAGLLAGSAALVLADRAPQGRRREQAGARDALWLGLAQASALVPGVSRNGATLAAARFRGFRRVDANVLSRHVALPIIAGASGLKGLRLARRLRPGAHDEGAELAPRTAAVIAAGAIATFASTLAAIRLIGVVERDRPLAVWAAYRTVVAVGILAVWRRRMRETVERS